MSVKKFAAEVGVAYNTGRSWERAVSFPGSDNQEAVIGYTGLRPCQLVCPIADKCVPARCPYLPSLHQPPTGRH